MVCALTAGREKYAAHQALIADVQKRAEALRPRLLEVMDRDTEAFLTVSAAFALPKGTEEEKAARSQAIQRGLELCTEVPLEGMELAGEVLELAGSILGRCNESAASDLGVAALSLRAGIQGAWLNVLINVGSLRDRAFADRALARGRAILDRALPWRTTSIRPSRTRSSRRRNKSGRAFEPVRSLRFYGGYLSAAGNPAIFDNKWYFAAFLAKCPAIFRHNVEIKKKIRLRGLRGPVKNFVISPEYRQKISRISTIISSRFSLTGSHKILNNIQVQQVIHIFHIVFHSLFHQYFQRNSIDFHKIPAPVHAVFPHGKQTHLFT